MTLQAITYTGAVLDSSVDGNLNDTSYNLFGHWAMNETSGTVLNGLNAYGVTSSSLQGTYRIGSTLGQPSIMPGLSDTSVYSNGDTSVGGSYINNNSDINNFTNNATVVFNAWVQPNQTPQPYFFKGATATVSGSTMSLTSSSASTISGYMKTYIDGYNSGTNNYFIQVVGSGIPAGTTVSTVSYSGTKLNITLNKSSTVSGSYTITNGVDISVADTSQSFGYITWKPNDFSFTADAQIGGLRLGSFASTISGYSPSDALSWGDPYMLTCQINSGVDVADFYFWVNSVYLGTTSVPGTLNASTSSNIYFGVSPAPQNKYGSRALYTNNMQHVTFSNTRLLATWALQNLYVIGTQGTLYYDPSIPNGYNYRYPAVVSGSTYVKMPASVNVYPWETTIAPANPSRKSITLVNDSPGYIMIGLCYTDYTTTNTSFSPLSLNRPDYSNGMTPPSYKRPGIVLQPRGGTWSSDYYQGPISAVSDLYSGYYNLTAIEDV